MSAPTAQLTLDEDSIPVEELSLPALIREIELQRRPTWILSKIMNALEAKRQARGMGWSRAWNKRGLNVFRTHTQSLALDTDYFAPVFPLLKSLLEKAPQKYLDFAYELLGDDASMAFTFYHNNDTEADQYEGLTLSFGRKVASDRSKRDRLDIIIEDLRVDGAVDGNADRVRLFVCPWDSYKEAKRHWKLEIDRFDPSLNRLVNAAYRNSIDHYDIWKSDETRQWSHWSARYIDYFGPRRYIPRGSSFS